MNWHLAFWPLLGVHLIHMLHELLFMAKACVDKSVTDSSEYFRIPFFFLPPTYLHYPLHGATRAQESEHWKKMRRKAEYRFYTFHTITPPSKLVLMPGLSVCPVANTVTVIRGMLGTMQSHFKNFSQAHTQPNLTSALTTLPLERHKEQWFFWGRGRN